MAAVVVGGDTKEGSRQRIGSDKLVDAHESPEAGAFVIGLSEGNFVGFENILACVGGMGGCLH